MGVNILRRPLHRKGAKKSEYRFGLYLDITHEGRRWKESLKLILFAGETAENREKERLAERRRAEKLSELNNLRFGYVPQANKNRNFLDYFEELVRIKDVEGHNWHSTAVHLRKFAGGYIPFKKIDELWLEEFKRFLLDNFKRNSAHTYWSKVKAALRQAVKDKVIQVNPAEFVDQISREEVPRSYLTLDEVQRLAGASCPDPELKRAFLFACFSGLRVSDVRALQWPNSSEYAAAFENKLHPAFLTLHSTRVCRGILDGFDSITASKGQVRFSGNLVKALGLLHTPRSVAEVRIAFHKLSEKLHLDLLAYGEVKGFDLNIELAIDHRPEEVFRGLGRWPSRARVDRVHPSEGCSLEYPGAADSFLLSELPVKEQVYGLGMRMIITEDAKRFSDDETLLTLEELLSPTKYTQLANFLGAGYRKIEKVLAPIAVIDHFVKKAGELNDWVYALFFERIMSKQRLESVIIAAKKRNEITADARDGMIRKLRKLGAADTAEGSENREQDSAYFAERECVAELNRAVQEEIARQIASASPKTLEPF